MKKYDLLNWTLATFIACLTATASGVASTLLLHFVAERAAKISELAPWALPVMLLIVGALAGLIWWWIRLKRGGSIVGVVQKGEENLLFGRSALDAGLQVTSVGFGTSMGREAAPRLLASALTWNLIRTMPHDLRVLATAGAAGGALGVVYDAPWAGTVYTLTILLPTLEWRTVLTATAASWGGVELAKFLIGDHSNYALGPVEVNAVTWFWVLLSIFGAPVIGLAFKWMQKRFISGKVPLKALPLTVALSFAVVGVVGLIRPEILGNGVSMVQHSLAGDTSWQILLLLVLLKSSLTVLVLSSGAVGGVLMPAFALGAVAGGAGAALVPGGNVAVFVMVMAAAVLSVTEKSWLFGVCFALELVDAPVQMWLPVVVAGLGAFLVAHGYNSWAAKRKA